MATSQTQPQTQPTIKTGPAGGQYVDYGTNPDGSAMNQEQWQAAGGVTGGATTPTPTQPASTAPGASSSGLSGSWKGNGWDQYATDPSSFQYGLGTALSRGLKGDDALNWMQNNGWAGAVNQNGSGIEAYGNGTFGLPNGYDVLPNGGGGFDIRVHTPAGGGSSPNLTALASSLGGMTPSPTPAGTQTPASPTDPSSATPSINSGSNLQALLAQLMGGSSRQLQ